MDPALAPVIARFFDAGLALGILGIAVWWFSVRDKRNEMKAEAMRVAMDKAAAERERKAAEDGAAREKRCEDRNAALDGRVVVLEQRLHEQMTEVAERAISGLAENILLHKAIMRREGLTAADLLSLTPPEALPALGARRRTPAGH